jgi:hypothetical protein
MAKTRPNIIFRFGLWLFVLSFILPSGHALSVPTMGDHVNDYLHPFMGCYVFINTPSMLWFIPLWCGPPIDDGFTWYGNFVNFILLGAWLANFAVFFRLPLIIGLVVIALPWIAFVCWFDVAAGFVPFYFWALGITFIHLSRILRPTLKPAQMQRPEKI